MREDNLVMMSSYANLEIIGNNDEQQSRNSNKMDPKSKLCVFGGFLKKNHI
jgi:hypothetical protein